QIHLLFVEISTLYSSRETLCVLGFQVTSSFVSNERAAFFLFLFLFPFLFIEDQLVLFLIDFFYFLF
ncbi:MAG: hypothetical protein N7Q72_02555, partial [Spiroplasma sp. Tabriz.8]|nr:hypothetical protein [Spiroplasma sp. Tabriz.8]